MGTRISDIERMFREMDSLVDKDGNLKDAERYEAVLEEIITTWPFSEIRELRVQIGELESAVSKLKRHRHDQTSGAPVSSIL